MNARDRTTKSDPLLKNFILFSPNKASKWCKKPVPDVACEPVEWSIKAPVGTYETKITVGDSEKRVGYSMTVND
jgi:hypothetical protein